MLGIYHENRARRSATMAEITVDIKHAIEAGLLKVLRENPCSAVLLLVRPLLDAADPLPITIKRSPALSNLFSVIDAIRDAVEGK